MRCSASDISFFESKPFTEYLCKWLEHWHHVLKHAAHGAINLLNELEEQKKELSGVKVETVQKTITHFSNHLLLTWYGSLAGRCLPIGSGVTETACKTVVESRTCVSGADWSPKGCGVVLTLCALHLGKTTWNSFWAKINHYGLPNVKSSETWRKTEKKRK